MTAVQETDGARAVAAVWSAQGSAKLRVGIFADSPQQPRWMVEALAKVAVSDFAEVVAAAEGCAPRANAPWLWRTYCFIDRWTFGVPPDPSARIGLQHLIPCGQSLSLPFRGAAPAAVADWRAEIADLRFDVAFVIGDVDDQLVEGAAKYGIWRFCFGEDRGSLEAVAGFREVTDGVPVTATGLKVRRGAAGERLVYESWSRTNLFSMARSRENFLRKTSAFAARAMRELHRSGDAWLERCAPIADPARGAVEHGPGTAEIARGLSRLGGRIARRALQKLFYVDQWILAYRFRRRGERGQDDGQQFTRLMPPKDRYWADPFPIERNGRHYVFFEELVFASGKAHIAMVEVARDGTCSAPVRVLERDYHLSYPFLIEQDGELFMVPETQNNRSVELYRCIAFPDRWRLERVLLRGALCADATFHRENGNWWMFVNIGVEGVDPHDELHLFCADRLQGEWKPHHSNPVKSDVRCARPAGKLYRRDGILYRPAQIGAPLYGSGVSINRVLHLSPQAYLEQEVERVLPSPSEGLLGIHTLNRAGELSVIDGFVRRPRLPLGWFGTERPDDFRAYRAG